jgi:NAD+ synthase (glutamine-hydrolysing)
MTESTVSSRRPLRIALAQTNLLVGDIDGNADTLIRLAIRARDEIGAHLVLFPELAITSYPPEDLLLRAGLYDRVDAAVARIRRQVSGIDVLIGLPERDGNAIYNACILLRDGKPVASCRKRNLPNYAVFDEKRYFREGPGTAVVDIGGIPTGVTICEDIWEPEPARAAAAAGARLLLNVNASPYHVGKQAEREALVASRASENGFPVIYLNLVGGQDELVFDGGSFAMNPDGTVAFRAPAFEEGLFLVEVQTEPELRARAGNVASIVPVEESIYTALVTGVRDYVTKNGFRGTVVGLSGGIDSALTLAIAVDALGAGSVEAVLMPSRYTAPMSVEDARQEAETLRVTYHVISIEPPFRAFVEALEPVFAGVGHDVTEQNIQARCRGVILMALSNKQGRMVLTTGNKSELAVGYATLYGDMAGGFAPLKDVPKQVVYRLAAWRNRREAVIPPRVLERAPSAELAPDQRDEDSLPPYQILDAILERYVEQDRCPEEIVAAGFDPAVVEHVVALVNHNEYKRRQAAPGVRITRRAFGRDRRYPITSGYD